MSVVAPAPERTPTPYAVAARALLRDTLLDAARRELEQRAWSEVTMADIALAAGVSRQTLYKEFGSRESSPRRSSCARPSALSPRSRRPSTPTSTTRSRR